ncbi:MAG: hypothetical protein ACRC1D_03360, partial [Culicoidibacterales bacterium]
MASSSSSTPQPAPQTSNVKTKHIEQFFEWVQRHIKTDTETLPLQALKRTLAALTNDEKVDVRLRELGEDPDALRKKWAFFISQPKKKFGEIGDKEVITYARNMFDDKETLVFNLQDDNDDYAGSGYEYYYPECINYKAYYVAVSFKKDLPRIRVIKA